MAVSLLPRVTESPAPMAPFHTSAEGCGALSGWAERLGLRLSMRSARSHSLVSTGLWKVEVERSLFPLG
ncbi:MAG: hypothetical protein Kow001_01250 [Acidobacteriota bacterium]